MSWALLLAMAAGAYGFKALGLLVLGGRPLPESLVRCVALLPAALLSALILVQTFTDGRSLVLDARAAGVGVAAVLAWRKAAFWLVILAAAATTAALRALA